MAYPFLCVGTNILASGFMNLAQNKSLENLEISEKRSSELAGELG